MHSPGYRRDDVAIPVLALRSEVIKDGGFVFGLVDAEHFNDLQKGIDVVLTADCHVILVAALRAL